jgi:hypothetical protein
VKFRSPLYQETKAFRQPPRGVGGWLLLFCADLTILSPIENGLQLLTDVISENNPLQLIVLIASSVAPFGYGIFAGIMLWMVRPGAVRHGKTYLIISLCTALIKSGMAVIESNGRLPSFFALVPAIASFAIWWIYLSQSRRVRNTYFAQP